MTPFARYIAVDWSGAGKRTDAVDLAIAEAAPARDAQIISPSKRKKWSRDECAAWLATKLRPSEPRTLVLVDAGFAYPAGAARAVFDANGWPALVATLGERYARHETARKVAEEINARFEHGAPFRFDTARADGRWYAKHGVGYFRQAELLVPQVISQFYLGSGAVVGYHTITFLAELAALMQRRATGELSFAVWPNETFDPDNAHHVLVECYPAACRAALRLELPAARTSHEADALITCEWARRTELARDFALREVPIGRATRLDWRAQLGEEGWILGVAFG